MEKADEMIRALRQELDWKIEDIDKLKKKEKLYMKELQKAAGSKSKDVDKALIQKMMAKDAEQSEVMKMMISQLMQEQEKNRLQSNNTELIKGSTMQMTVANQTQKVDRRRKNKSLDESPFDKGNINTEDFSEDRIFSLRVHEEETHSKHRPKIPLIDLSFVTSK